MIDVLAIIISFITLLFTIINQINILRDKEPQLSFSLKDIDNILYLKIINYGQTTAKNIKIKIDKIYNNGSSGLQEDLIFQIPFELASYESVQGMVAFNGQNISNHTFPYIEVEIQYKKAHFKRNVKYKRTVFYTASFENKIKADVNLDLNDIEKNVNKINKSLLRLANYFDGNEIAPFDELNIVSKNHFQKDLLNTKNNISSETKTREKSIESRL